AATMARTVRCCDPRRPRTPVSLAQRLPVITSARANYGAVVASRLRRAVLAGHHGKESEARDLLSDPDPGVRAAAPRALCRMGAALPADVSTALADPDPGVRR